MKMSQPFVFYLLCTNLRGSLKNKWLKVAKLDQKKNKNLAIARFLF